ncbi:MAG: T9SS type A sorting domain-containing protein [Calditrichaceae bacterium]
MKILSASLIVVMIIWNLLFLTTGMSQGLIIDHTCTDLSQIPGNWIDSVKAKIKWHYAHTSHGGQLTYGLSYIEGDNAGYNVARQSSSLPTESGALCIFDGQEHDTYITPDEYWETGTGMNYTRAVLMNNTSLNVSQWSWCTQQDGNSEATTQAYLDSMAFLEEEFPEVTFIYMTGNAQASGSSGYNRYIRNEQIRNYCQDNNKILFDFADLDAWCFNSTTEQWEFNSYNYEGIDVPIEHSEFNGDEQAHTTYSSCRQKGRAVWWMMAVLAGWESVTSGNLNPVSQPLDFSLEQNYPNPFNPTTTISYTVGANNRSPIQHVDLSVYNLLGQKVATLVSEKQPAGSYQINFDASYLAAGIYFYKLTTVNFEQIRRMVLVK